MSQNCPLAIHQGGGVLEISRRRVLIWGSSALVAILSGCMRVTNPQEEEQPQLLTNKVEDDLVQSGSVADFLQKRAILVEYSEQTDWNFGSGLLLLNHLVTSRGDHGQDGYEFFINGECVQGPINLVSFNGRKSLVIKRNGQLVWHYKPGRRPNVHMHEAALPEPT